MPARYELAIARQERVKTCLAMRVGRLGALGLSRVLRSVADREVDFGSLGQERRAWLGILHDHIVLGHDVVEVTAPDPTTPPSPSQPRDRRGWIRPSAAVRAASLTFPRGDRIAAAAATPSPSESADRRRSSHQHSEAVQEVTRGFRSAWRAATPAMLEDAVGLDDLHESRASRVGTDTRLLEIVQGSSDVEATTGFRNPLESGTRAGGTSGRSGRRVLTAEDQRAPACGLLTH